MREQENSALASKLQRCLDSRYEAVLLSRCKELLPTRTLQPHDRVHVFRESWLREQTDGHAADDHAFDLRVAQPTHQCGRRLADIRRKLIRGSHTPLSTLPNGDE